MVAVECKSEESRFKSTLYLLFLSYFKSEGCWLESREQSINKILSAQIRNIPTPLPYQGSAQVPHHDTKYSAQKRRIGFVTLISLWCMLKHYRQKMSICTMYSVYTLVQYSTCSVLNARKETSLNALFLCKEN